MKNLKIKYKKVKLQKLECGIQLSENKPEVIIDWNKIGFGYEYYDPKETDYVNNFCNYSHLAEENNKKLYRKYPIGVIKRNRIVKKKCSLMKKQIKTKLRRGKN